MMTEEETMAEDKKDGVVLYGCGGHCKVVAEILRCMGIEVTGIVDDNPRVAEYKGIPVVRKDEGRSPVIITIGNCAIRKRIAGELGEREFPVAVHPTAILAEGVEIGAGSVVCAGAIIQPEATVGRHCIINTRSVVEHDCVVGDYVHVATGAVLCGGVEIGEGSWIGAGSVVRQGIRIGSGCMIGAGSVVVKDIPDGVTAYGNPCRVRM